MRKFLLSSALICAASLAQAEDAALIVGISDYRNLPDVADAQSVADAGGDLRQLGFLVFGRDATTGADLKVQANAFALRAPEADRLIAALSGRFVTNGRDTWLLPADAEPPAVFGLENGAISVSTALRLLGDAPGAALLVLGRDDGAGVGLPTGLRYGIGDLDIPSGVTVVQGSVAATADLLDRVIAVPGGDVISGIRRSRALTGSGFMPSQLVLIPANARPVVQRQIGDQNMNDLSGFLEDAQWNAAQRENTQASYAAYLDRFPDGAHANDAVARLRALRDPSFAFKQAEDALNLPVEARRAVQRDLQVLGFDTRGIDGIFGPGSRGAIKTWQSQNSVTPTGFLTADTVVRLHDQAGRRAAELELQAQQRRAENEAADRAYWGQTGSSGRPADLRSYLERFPDGAFAPQAQAALAERRQANRDAAAQADRALWDDVVKRDKVNAYNRYLNQQPDGAFRDDAAARIRQLQGADAAQAANDVALATERALALDPISLRLIEARLDQLGLNPGAVDGNIDGDTRAAIRRYQGDRQLTASGYLDQATVSQMLTDAFR